MSRGILVGAHDSRSRINQVLWKRANVGVLDTLSVASIRGTLVDRVRGSLRSERVGYTKECSKFEADLPERN